MELEMTDEQKEVFERLMAIPVMEYDLNDPTLDRDILVGWLLQISFSAQKIADVMYGLEVSEESRQCLEKDYAKLVIKHQLIARRLGLRGIDE